MSTDSTSIGPEQQRRLVSAKLKALVRGHLGSELTIDESLGAAGGFVASAGERRHGVFYATSLRMGGPALMWAQRSSVEHLHLVAEPDVAGDLARRTADIDHVTVGVLAVDGTDLRPAAPTELPAPPVVPASVWELAATMSDAGARVVDDHGRLVAEADGLEIARISLAGPPSGGEPAIEVGVGEADRELHSLVHTTMDTPTALRRAIELVGAERRAGSLHPLARMARERWLRATLLADPTSIGAIELTAVPPLIERATVLGNVPAAAIGTLDDGRPVVVVCSTGIDLDLPLEAADYRRRHATDLAGVHKTSAELIMVVPERDRHPATVSLAAAIDRATVVGVVPPW